jgi:WD40 repeat protein
VLKMHVFSDSILAIYADMSIGTYRWYPGSRTDRLRMDKLRTFAQRELSISRSAIKRGSAIPLEAMDKSQYQVRCSSFAVTLGGRAKELLRRKSLFPSSRLMNSADISLTSAEANAYVISCGYWDNTVKMHSLDTLRVLSSETGRHIGPVQCLAISDDGSIMATGGHDGTCRLWVVDHPDMAAVLTDGYVQTSIGSRYSSDQLLTCFHVLWGHDTPVTCVEVCPDLDIVASGSQGGFVCIHTIRRGDFVRSFKPSVSATETIVGVARLTLHTSGLMVAYMTDQSLHTCTINGVHLASVDTGESLNDMQVCSNGSLIVTGGDKGQVLVRSLPDLQICAMLDLTRHGPIQCIAFTPEDLNPIRQFLFVGSDDGMITVIDEDPLKTQEGALTF